MIQFAITAHGVAGMRFEHDVAHGPAGARQDKSRLAILGVIPAGIPLVHVARQQACRARQAPALQAPVRQIGAGCEAGVEKMLILGDGRFHL